VVYVVYRGGRMWSVAAPEWCLKLHPDMHVVCVFEVREVREVPYTFTPGLFSLLFYSVVPVLRQGAATLT